MMLTLSTVRALSIAVAALVVCPPSLVHGQVTAPRDSLRDSVPVAGRPGIGGGGRAEATREELKALLGGSNLSASEAVVVRRRLEEGDFQPGDRILLSVLDEPTLTDTFTVRAGSILPLPNLPDIPLKGLLRSELQPHLTKKIGALIRNPAVEATSLIRVAVLGEVARPGFYTVPAGMLASEAVMAAGGPSTRADLKKTTIHRGPTEVADRQEVQEAFAKGQSLDQLNLQGGDELRVGQKSGNILPYLQALGAAAGLAFVLIRIFP